MDFVRQNSPPSTSVAATKRTPGCHRCRERHVKCNKERPVCSNCRNARATSPCRYEAKRGIRFRSSRYSSGPNVQSASPGTESQKYGASSSNKRDSSGWGTVANRNDRSLDFSEQGPTQLRGNYRPTITTNSFGNIDTASVEETATSWGTSQSGGLQSRPVAPYLPQESPVSLWTGVEMPSPLARDESGSSASAARQDRDLTPRILDDSVDCKVFDFYVRHVGHWIDIGSPSHYFQRRVPRLALVEPLLLFACLSCAAHIMSLVGKIEKSAEEHYRGKVLELLIPLLSSDRATSSNEVLLATTIILRMSEQFEEDDTDAQCHLNGAASLFTDGTDWSSVEDSLGVACFWTYLRESIRVCFLREQPCHFGLDQLSLGGDDISWVAGKACDEYWTNKMTYLLLQTCNLCWGRAIEDPGTSLVRLRSLLDAWRQNVPRSFQPWCVREADDQPFPEFRCFDSLHVVAWQFYYTARVMLAVHSADERRRTSPGAFTRHLEAAIVTPTRWLCGLCFSSTENVGTNLNGSHLMAWCGQFLPGKRERKALWDFLHDFGQTTGWPVAASCRRLEQAWKGSGRSWADC